MLHSCFIQSVYDKYVIVKLCAFTIFHSYVQYRDNGIHNLNSIFAKISVPQLIFKMNTCTLVSMKICTCVETPKFVYNIGCDQPHYKKLICSEISMSAMRPELLPNEEEWLQY